MNEYYAVLGVTKTVSDLELKKAYRIMAKKYHPDLHPGDQEAEKKFQFINEAYSILSDPDKRKQYDAKQESSQNRSHEQKTKKAKPFQTDTPNFSQMHAGFEQFFGFDPKDGKITNEEKLKPKNPLDVSDMFEKFMGMK